MYERLETGDITPESWRTDLKATGGISIADMRAEVKRFAFAYFHMLDQDGDGFLTKAEMHYAFSNDLVGWREKSFLLFLMRQSEQIAAAYDEEWAPDAEGMSLADLQEYFKDDGD